MKNLLKNKKGQALGLTGGVVGALLGLIVFVIAALLVLSILQNANLFTANSVYDNATDNAIANTTVGVSNFFAYIPTVFTILAVVLLLSIIAILILVVRKFSGGTTSGL